MTDVWSQYAAALGRMGRYQEAFEAYGRVIKLQPDEPNGPLGASSMLLLLNRPDDARAHAELAIASAPSQAHQALALIAVSRQRDDEALRQADLAAAAEPGLPMPAFIRGTLAYNHQQHEPALGFLLQAQKGYAGRSAQPRDLHFMIGDSLARLERYKEAEPYLEEEVRLYPQHVRARAGLAMLYQSMGRNAEAERALGDLVRDVPSPDAADTAARVWHVRPSRPSGFSRRRGATKASRTVTGHKRATRSRAFAAVVLLLAALAAVWWWTRRPTGFIVAPDADRNVLVVTIDTLRADAMSAYGGRASTPRIDALAARGARFTFAHAHAVVTLPSHTSLLTGVYPSSTASATTTAIGSSLIPPRSRCG